MMVGEFDDSDMQPLRMLVWRLALAMSARSVLSGTIANNCFGSLVIPHRHCRGIKTWSSIIVSTTCGPRHYGFADEELDFIINFDIKYRMGLTGEQENEE
jgi:hypothetical protein